MRKKQAIFVSAIVLLIIFILNKKLLKINIQQFLVINNLNNYCENCKMVIDFSIQFSTLYLYTSVWPKIMEVCI